MFEGSEKKLELLFSPYSPSLRERPLKFWKSLVQSCGADIISHSEFPKVQSYLLSESSLFVWDHRLILITCGKTVLSQALIKILKSFPKNSIKVCFFQRKNEFFPQIQKSCFYKDLKKIQKKITGQAYRFGPLHDHHFFLFHNTTDFTPEEEDQTLEILIYDSELLKDHFQKNILHLKQRLEKAFYGFELQDHFFEPLGYSLNAVKEKLYYTVHITPEKSFFYISFETNIKEKSLQILTNKVLQVFEPIRFDFIFFKPQKQEKEIFESPDYFSCSSYFKVLSCGYTVTYKSLHKKHSPEKEPLLINKK